MGYALVAGANIAIPGMVEESFFGEALTELELEDGDLVIGKMGDLEELGPGERTLSDHGQMPKQETTKLHYEQNSSRLRYEMSKGRPIRDASAGKPGSECGFLRLEHDILRARNWTLESDGYWHPPVK